MVFVKDAWRLLDGTYRLRSDFPTRGSRFSRVRAAFPMGGRSMDEAVAEGVRIRIRNLGGRGDARSDASIVPASGVDRPGLERIFVVVAAGYCCRGPSRAEARAYQIRRCAIFRVFCESCGKRPPDATLWEVPIIETCGEGEEGRLTYETAFRAAFEG